MRKIIDFLVRYPIWANVVMFSTLGFGLITFSQMSYSFFPELQTGIITIQVIYPGASPQEIEEGVILKIEENLDGSYKEVIYGQQTSKNIRSLNKIGQMISPSEIVREVKL